MFGSRPVHLHRGAPVRWGRLWRALTPRRLSRSTATRGRCFRRSRAWNPLTANNRLPGARTMTRMRNRRARPGSAEFPGSGEPGDRRPGERWVSHHGDFTRTGPARRRSLLLWATLPSFADSENSASSSAQAEISLRDGPLTGAAASRTPTDSVEAARLRESGVRTGLWSCHDVQPALSGPDRETTSTHSEVAAGLAGPSRSVPGFPREEVARPGRSQLGSVVCSSRVERCRARLIEHERAKLGDQLAEAGRCGGMASAPHRSVAARIASARKRGRRSARLPRHWK